MIRPLRFETLRYGPRSGIADSVSTIRSSGARSGPARPRGVGGSTRTVELRTWSRLTRCRGLEQPPYEFLAERRVDLDGTARKLAVMASVGVPYREEEIKYAARAAREQGEAIADHLASVGVTVAADSEMVAVIAYLQCLGTKAPPPPETAPLPVETAEASDEKLSKRFLRSRPRPALFARPVRGRGPDHVDPGLRGGVRGRANEALLLSTTKDAAEWEVTSTTTSSRIQPLPNWWLAVLFAVVFSAELVHSSHAAGSTVAESQRRRAVELPPMRGAERPGVDSPSDQTAGTVL